MPSYNYTGKFTKEMEETDGGCTWGWFINPFHIKLWYHPNYCDENYIKTKNIVAII